MTRRTRLNPYATMLDMYPTPVPTLEAIDVTADSINLQWTPVGATVTEVGRDGVDTLGNAALSGLPTILPFRNLLPATTYNLYAVINGIPVTVSTTTLDAVEETGLVIWQDRIDSAPDGTLTSTTASDLFSPVAEAINSSYLARGSVASDGAGGKLLRHTIPSGTLGDFIMSPLLDHSTDHATLQYDIRFNSGFQWRWGGKMGPGLVGVLPGHSVYEPTSGNPDRNIGFSTRLMWHGRGDDGSRPFQSMLGAIPVGTDNEVVTYIYARYPQAGFSGFGFSYNTGMELLEDTWHTIKMEVKLNTVGQADGVYKLWIDGVLELSFSNFDYRNNAGVKISACLWDIHRGGDLSGSWTSSTNDTVDIRNVVVKDLSTATAPVALTSDGFGGSAGALNGGALDLALGGSAGTWTAAANIERIAGAVGVATAGFALARTNVGVSDGYAEVLYTVLHGANIYVSGRSDNSNSNMYRVGCTNPGAVLIEKVVAGSSTNLYTSANGLAGVGDYIGIGLSGSEVTVYVNRTVVQTVIDTSLTTGTYWGLGFGGGSTTGRVDDFKVSAASSGTSTEPLRMGVTSDGQSLSAALAWEPATNMVPRWGFDETTVTSNKIQVDQTGSFPIVARAQFGGATTGSRGFRITRNGVVVHTVQATSPTASNFIAGTSPEIALVAGDLLGIEFIHHSGNSNTRNVVWGHDATYMYIGTDTPMPAAAPAPASDVLWRDKFVAAVPGRINKSLGDAMFGASIGGRNADGTYYDGATTDGTFTNGEIVEESGQKFLRHHIYAGSEGMLILTPQLYREATHATIEYDVRFDPDFDWQWGGKLACGLVGVKPGYGLNAPTSGNTYREFSTRLMWHGNCTNGLGTGRPFPTKLPVIPAGESDIVTYVYALYPGTLGYPNNIGFNNYGWHTSLGAMSKGAWHTIKCETGLNTVGSNNGIFRTWIDGVLKFEATNWNYRSDSSVTIQAVLWDVHRGGGLPDWASPQDCWVDVRNVTVREL